MPDAARAAIADQGNNKPPRGGDRALLSLPPDQQALIARAKASGTALARLLFGDVSPSARLPFTVARDAGDYPFFYREATAITYDRWHGYTKFEREGIEPRYAFGRGLSYTGFAYRALKVADRGECVELQVSVTNTGARAAEHVVLAFAHPPGEPQDTPARLLKAFARVALEPGDNRHAILTIPKSVLSRYDAASRSWHLVKGSYRFSVGDTAASIVL